MWLRGHPAERLAILIAGLVITGAIWQLWIHHVSTAAASQPASQAGQLSSSPALPQFGSTPPADQLDHASAVARQFLVSMETYRFDDNPSSQGARVRPYASQTLYNTLFSQPSNSHSGRPDLHEIDQPTVSQLTSEGYAADGQLGFLAQVDIVRTTDQGATHEQHAYELFLITEQRQWKVNDFTLGASKPDQLESS
jgi:hypothetical protein